MGLGRVQTFVVTVANGNQQGGEQTLAGLNDSWETNETQMSSRKGHSVESKKGTL